MTPLKCLMPPVGSAGGPGVFLGRTNPRQEPELRSRMGRCISVTVLASLVILGYLLWYTKLEASSRNCIMNDLFDKAPLIDSHNDFPIWIRAFYNNHIYQGNFTREPKLYGQVDFPRLQQGRLRGQLWSVYIECPKNASDYSDNVYGEIIHDTLQQIDLVYRLIQEYPMYLDHAYTAADIWKTFKSGSRIASLLGIEGLHQIGNSASILRMYHSLGVRYATLTHTCHNAYADSEEPAKPLHGGLSKAGKAMVREMNRLGVIIDLSHTSFETQRDALRISAAPVIFSHSNAYALCNHTRNVPDDILQALKSNGGVVMVTFYPAFLDNDITNASLASIADHIQYIGETIGYEHVGIGSDFDGMEVGPEGVEDVTKYPDIVKELQLRGVVEGDILRVMGMNIIRVLEDAEKMAIFMKHVLPLEDNVKPFFE